MSEQVPETIPVPDAGLTEPVSSPAPGVVREGKSSPETASAETAQETAEAAGEAAVAATAVAEAAAETATEAAEAAADAEKSAAEAGETAVTAGEVAVAAHETASVAVSDIESIHEKLDKILASAEASVKNETKPETVTVTGASHGTGNEKNERVATSDERRRETDKSSAGRTDSGSGRRGERKRGHKFGR